MFVSPRLLLTVGVLFIRFLIRRLLVG
uniref:Uncharacterized protein n=1 Tax=Anguilla anguilla TaxID=7936 RepID=A0A0E9VCK3_ANGAN